MGAGILIFLVSIIVYILLLIVSIIIFRISKKSADLEASNNQLKCLSAARARADIIFIYAVLLMAFYYEFWLELLVKMLVDTAEPGLLVRLFKGLSDWDSWGEIVVYWRSLLIVYAIVLFRLYLFDKTHGIKWYKNNLYVAAIFNLGLYPFMVLGFVDWAFDWKIYTLFEEF